MPSKIPITTLRIKDPDYTKIRIIAEQNNRSVSKEIEYICKQHIEAYEARHGEIRIGGKNLPVTDQEQELQYNAVDYMVFDDNGEPMFTIETTPKKEK